MKALSPSSPSRLVAGAAAAAGLALVLSACGGESDSGADDEQNADQAAEQEGGEQEAEEPAAPETRQLSQEEIEEALSGISYEGEGFAAAPNDPPEMEAAKTELEKAPIEPAECKKVFLEQMGKADTDIPTGLAISEEHTYNAVAMSYASADEASEALDATLSTGSACEEMSIEAAGQKIEMSITVEEIDVPGADRAVLMTTSLPMAPDDTLYYVTALTANGLVAGSALHGSTEEKSTGVAAEAVNAYTEALQ